MKLYKVVKRKRNGARVSVLVPDWHPCYAVYQRNGENLVVGSGFCFVDYKVAEKWCTDQFYNQCIKNCEILSGEALEIWEVNYKKLSPIQTMLGLDPFLDKFNFGGFLRPIKRFFKNNRSYSSLLKFLQPRVKSYSYGLIDGARVADDVQLYKRVHQTPKKS